MEETAAMSSAREPRSKTLLPGEPSSRLALPPDLRYPIQSFWTVDMPREDEAGLKAVAYLRS
jgi:hypothetical protein